MSVDKIVGERVVYGILDWLGDLGGFSDGLKYIAIGVLFLT